MNPTCKKRLGAIRLETMKVVAQEEIAPAIFELVLEGEMVEAMRAGQFLHLRVPDDAHLLRRHIRFPTLGGGSPPNMYASQPISIASRSRNNDRQIGTVVPIPAA